MVVICEECGLKYQIDPSKIKGDKARFNCKGCSTSIVVDKRDAQVNEGLSALEEALLDDSSSEMDTTISNDDTGEVQEEAESPFSDDSIDEIPESAAEEPAVVAAEDPDLR